MNRIALVFDEVGHRSVVTAVVMRNTSPHNSRCHSRSTRRSALDQASSLLDPRPPIGAATRGGLTPLHIEKEPAAPVVRSVLQLQDFAQNHSLPAARDQHFAGGVTQPNIIDAPHEI